MRDIHWSVSVVRRRALLTRQWKRVWQDSRPHNPSPSTVHFVRPGGQKDDRDGAVLRILRIRLNPSITGIITSKMARWTFCHKDVPCFLAVLRHQDGISVFLKAHFIKFRMSFSSSATSIFICFSTFRCYLHESKSFNFKIALADFHLEIVVRRHIVSLPFLLVIF